MEQTLTTAPTKLARRHARAIARQMITSGSRRQDAFEHLKVISTNAHEELANIVRYIPTLEARRRYRSLQGVLIVLLVITILFKLAAALSVMEGMVIKTLLPLLFFPLINILLLWGVVDHRGEFYRFTALFAVLSITRMIGRADLEPITLVLELVLSMALITVGMMLNKKMTPDYQRIKEKYTNADGQARLRNVYRFSEPIVPDMATN